MEQTEFEDQEEEECVVQNDKFGKLNKTPKFVNQQLQFLMEENP